VTSVVLRQLGHVEPVEVSLEAVVRDGKIARVTVSCAAVAAQP
jgi:hypothetical protein